jgi:hypothetical protein
MNNIPDRESVVSNIQEDYISPTPLQRKTISAQEPLRLLIIVVLSVLSVEICVMMLVSILPFTKLWMVSLFDSAMLIALLSPVFYRFIYRPMFRVVE